MSNLWKRWIKNIMIIGILGLLLLVMINGIVISSTSKQILKLTEVEEADCILVLGAGVWAHNQPSPMLRDRLEKSVELFRRDVAPYVIMSGDHGRKDYDEVNVMKSFGINEGIDSDLIYMDHAGFSTYESLYRAKHIFKAQKIIIVTQRYHLYRALYIANALGLKAVGVPAKEITYSGQLRRDIREVLARVKDVVSSWIQPLPTFLGDPIPLGSGGDLTND